MKVRRKEASHATIPTERIGPRKRDGRARADEPITTPPATVAPKDGNEGLEALVQERLEAYVAALKGHHPRDLYALIMPQLERPLIRVAMELAEGRQSVAAMMLGIHRNTLRARIKELGLDSDFAPKPRR